MLQNNLLGILIPFADITLATADFFIGAMPYPLGFVTGAMLYVVVEELIPETSGEGRSDIEVLSFALGFTLMMALDVALS